MWRWDAVWGTIRRLGVWNLLSEDLYHPVCLRGRGKRDALQQSGATSSSA